MWLKSRLNGSFIDVGSWGMSPEERTLLSFRRRIKDFGCVVAGLNLSLSFLTITQSDLSVDSGYRWITRVVEKMRLLFKRRGLQLFYVAVLEIQQKRYVESGLLAPHWHIAIAHSLVDALPHAVKLKGGRIEKERNGCVVTWDWLLRNVRQEFGMYFCCDCWSPSVEGYLSKYLLKPGLMKEFKARLGRRVRVFASSRFPVEYQMRWFQKLEYDKLIEEYPDRADLFWRREGANVVGRVREVVPCVNFNDDVREKITFPRVSVLRGEWILPSSDDVLSDGFPKFSE